MNQPPVHTEETFSLEEPQSPNQDYLELPYPDPVLPLLDPDPEPENQTTTVEPVIQPTISSPYSTDQAKLNEESFDVVHVLPQVAEDSLDMENIIAQLRADVNKVPKNSEEYQRRLKRLREYVTLADNVFGEHDNFVNWFNESGPSKQHLVNNNGAKLGINLVKQPTASVGEVLENEQAVRHALQTSGLSLGCKITCFASGVWLLIEPFTITEFSSFCTKLSISSSEIGRKTAGALWSGDDVILNNLIIDAALGRVVETNVSDINRRSFDKVKLKGLLLITDITQLKAGLLAAMYPRGYPVWHPCSSKECNYDLVSAKGENGEYLADSLINFNEITHTCTESLSSIDLDYWSQPTVTVEEVKAYQKRREDAANSVFDSRQMFMSKNCFNTETEHWIKLKIPTMLEYTTESTKWCVSIETHISQLVDQYRPLAGDNEGVLETFRRERAKKYSMDIALGKYTPYVSYIETVEKDKPNTRKIYNTPATIATTLSEVYSSAPDALKNITTLVKKMKETSTMTFAGVPNFPCPLCKRGQCNNDDHSNKLIPMNLSSFFTTLIYWKYQN